MVGVGSLTLILGFGTSSWLFLKKREAWLQQTLLREEAEHARANEHRLRLEAEASARIAQAAILIAGKKLDEADRLVDGLQAPVIQPSLKAAGVFRDLGLWNIVQGRWKPAADRFLKLQLAEQIDKSDLTDVATRDLPAIATALIVAGDLASYRQLMQETAIRFAKTDNPVAAEQILKMSTFLPSETNSLVLLQPLERVAENSLVDEQAACGESRNMLAWRAHAVSMFFYRCGNYSSAANWARRCLGYGCADDSTNRVAMAHAILAMAAHRMNPADGEADLEAARAIIEAKFPNPADGMDGIAIIDASGFWNDWITARLLYEEADREIQGAVKK
jgi:hypothetical protein